MKRILLFFLLVISVHAQSQKTVTPNWVKSTARSITGDSTQSLRAQIAGYGYQTATQVRTIVSDSIATKLDADFSTYDAYTTPTDADILIVQKEGTTDLAKVELASLPASTVVSSLFNNYYTRSQIESLLQGLEDKNKVQDSIITSLELRIDNLEAGLPPTVPPLPPTDFVIQGSSSTQLAGSFTSPASVFDSVIVEIRQYAITDNNFYTRATAVDSGTTSFTISGLDSNTIYESRAYSVKYSGSVANYSNYTNSDTGRTLQGEPQTPPSGTIIGQWFVDNSVVSSGNGLSYATAWKNLSNINWGSVQAGDTIIIAGGTYKETLTIGQDDVVILASPHTGYNTKVILDGENTRTQGITNGSYYQYQDIEINGYNRDSLILRNYTYRPIEIRHKPNISIKNLTIELNNTGAFSAIFLYGTEWTTPPPYTASNYLIENVKITQDSGSYAGAGNSDGMQIGGVNGITIRDSYIQLQNADNTPHQDLIQFYHCKNITIDGIEGYQLNGGATNNKQGIYITDSGGDIKITNNYIYMGQNSFGSGIAIEQYDNTWWTTYLQPDSFIIANNTINCTNDSPNAIRLVQNISSSTFSANTFLLNNIFIEGTNAIDRKYFASGNNCNYNNYYEIGGSVSIYDQTTTSTGTTRTWATWQEYGFDLNSYTTNPSLTGYVPNASSDAVDNGTNTSAFGVTDDIEGTARPQNLIYDIGCYEQ